MAGGTPARCRRTGAATPRTGRAPRCSRTRARRLYGHSGARSISRPMAVRQNASSSDVSAMWVWSPTPSRRASSTDSFISRSLAENGEHGAIATRSMEPGDGSWNLLTARSVAASTESVSCTEGTVGGYPVRPFPWPLAAHAISDPPDLQPGRCRDPARLARPPGAQYDAPEDSARPYRAIAPTAPRSRLYRAHGGVHDHTPHPARSARCDARDRRVRLQRLGATDAATDGAATDGAADGAGVG